MTIRDAYDEAYRAQTDMRAHLPTLFQLAALHGRVTEFGVRHGTSTVALLAGLAERGDRTLISYDCEPCESAFAEIGPLVPPTVTWVFAQGRTERIPPISETDVLFIDSTHTAQQIYAELTRHADRVTRYLILHDTVSCAEFDYGQPGAPLGLLWGLHRYLYEHPVWRLVEESHADHGLRVYHRVGR